MDTPIHGKRTMIEVHRRRFRYKVCGKTTFEPLPDIDSKRQATKRLVALGNWNKEIFNYYENPVTNAYTESLNAIARQINRMRRGTASRFCGHDSSSRRRPSKKSPSLRKTPRQRPLSGYEFIQEFKRGLEGSDEEPVVEYGVDLLKLIQLFEDGYFS